MNSDIEEINTLVPEKVEKKGTTTHKKKAIEAISFVVIGHGLSQVIRLGGNVVLTRLLVPEMFGLVSLARVFVTGITLFSDVGIEPSIIRSKRSDEPAFLNTAWTLQIIRSVIIALFACAVAYPAVLIYKEPKLAYLIPMISVCLLIGGLQSTFFVKLDRELQQKKLMVIELTIQVVALACTILAAYFFRNVWALLVGELVGYLIRVIWSHILNKESPNHLAFEKEAVQEILTFGKWILVSTAMLFLATQSDRIILGKLLSMTWLGIYNIAMNLAGLPKQVITRVNSKVLFPLISKYSHFRREELRRRIRSSRGKILAIVALLLAAFGSFGDIAVYILFDERYHAAGWILPLLAFGMWPLILLSTIDSVLLAIGKSQYAAAGNMAKFIYMVILIPISFKLWGVFGAVLVVALNDLPSYVILNYGLYKEKLSLLKQDAWATLILIAGAAFFISLRLLFGIGLPGHASFFS